jgi:hypothetical protein
MAILIEGVARNGKYLPGTSLLVNNDLIINYPLCGW